MKLPNPLPGAMLAMLRSTHSAADALRQALKIASPPNLNRNAKTSDPSPWFKRGVASWLHAAPGGGDQVQQVVDPAAPGQFLSRVLHNAIGTRTYKVYLPTAYHGQALPLLVMLHGCTQNPDDFAAGTRMNQVAERHACLVVYPEQSKAANAHRCWNWFNVADQQRDRGEAALIADITRQMMADYHCDPRRIFVAGLSAGGAMAVIMGHRYPELYQALGVHSGLPYAAARDLPSALLAMRRGSAVLVSLDRIALPMIVFHGDRDTTVHARNATQIIAQALGQSAAAAEVMQAQAEHADGHAVGHAYTRAVYRAESNHPALELWTVHGAAHAWSGGSANGSYTDAAGPDASLQMMRFFLAAVQ